jgi:hypothetical protein
MTKRMTLAATLCALAATPGLAHAGSEYRVEATGTGTYKLNIDFSKDGSIETRTVEASFSWSSQLDGARFDDAGQLQGVAVAPRPTQLSGTLKRTLDLVNPTAPDRAIHVTCEGADVRDAAISTSALTAVDGKRYTLSFRPFDFVTFEDAKCSGAKTEAWEIFQTDGDPYTLFEPAGDLRVYEQRFELPPEAVGMGKIVQFVKPQPGQVIAGDCPGYSQAPGERCSSTLDWSGTVTFTKTGDWTVTGPPKPGVPKPVDDGDDLIAPLVPTKPLDDGDDLIAPLVPARPKVAPGARTLSFKASCPAGCTGTATIAPIGGARAAGNRTLRFRVAAGPRARSR